ncbi:hypothetical protein HDV06_001389 [Boothiomyces sp. JEL0866]|nr:hypothetical protein HDV06_001389 [Boothiomyces sp. JEL0866]
MLYKILTVNDFDRLKEKIENKESYKWVGSGLDIQDGSDLPAVKWEGPVSPIKDFQAEETKEAEENKELFPHCYSTIDFSTDIERTLEIKQLPEFFDHLDSVFKAPRSFFVDHWELDPHRDINGIFVALYEGRIVSSVRVYSRVMSIYGEFISVGALGDVATKPEHTRKGLAKQLLDLALNYMQKFALTTLHTTAHGNAFKLYQSKGYHPWPLKISKTTIQIQQTLKVREIDLINDDLSVIQELHLRHLNSTVGSFKRELEFWRGLGKEVARKDAKLMFVDGADKGYAYLQHDGDCIQILDFYATGNHRVMLESMLYQLCHRSNVEISHPTLLLPDFLGGNQEIDEGYMVQLTQPLTYNGKVYSSTLEFLDLVGDMKFVFLKTDRY